jgi:streptogramin lyase
MRFNGISQGEDGAMYATANAQYFSLVRVGQDGTVSYLSDMNQGEFMAVSNAPDGLLWATTERSTHGYLVSFDPKTQQFGQTVAGTKGSWSSVVFGPDGNVWAASFEGSTVSVYIIQAMQVSPNVVTVPVGAQTSVIASESNYGGVWTAIPTDTKLVSVSPQNADGSFTLTGLAPGFTTVLVYDSMFNSVKVKVTVTAQ